MPGRLLRVGMGRRVERGQRTRRGAYPSKRRLHRNRKEIFCSILQTENVHYGPQMVEYENRSTKGLCWALDVLRPKRK